MHLVNYVDEVLKRCEVCHAPEKAPHVPISGASAASMFSEKLHVTILF